MAHGFTTAVALVLNCLFEFLTLINLSGTKSDKIGKNIVSKAMNLTACLSDYYAFEIHIHKYMNKFLFDSPSKHFSVEWTIW